MDPYGLFYTRSSATVPINCNRPAKPVYQRYRKPPYTYTGMIIMAIENSPKKKLLLSEIHEALGKMFLFFRQSSYTGWKDSIRHNLSHSQCFKLILKDPKKKNGKGNFWTVDLSQVKPDVFRRQETPVSREGNWALELHQQLGCPAIPIMNVRQRSPTAPALISTESNVNVRQFRKRKLEEESGDSLPAEKRHQPFHIENLLNGAPAQHQDVKPHPSFASHRVTHSFSVVPVGIQPSTPETAEKGIASSSDDSGCYVSSSSSTASPETYSYSHENSRHFSPDPRFPPEDYTDAMDYPFSDFYWPSFEGNYSAGEDASQTGDFPSCAMKAAPTTSSLPRRFQNNYVPYFTNFAESTAPQFPVPSYLPYDKPLNLKKENSADTDYYPDYSDLYCVSV